MICILITSKFNPLPKDVDTTRSILPTMMELFKHTLLIFISLGGFSAWADPGIAFQNLVSRLVIATTFQFPNKTAVTSLTTGDCYWTKNVLA